MSRALAATTVATIALLGIGATAYAATFIVTSGARSGPGSLRQAVLDANASPGRDTITFAPGVTSVQTNLPAAALDMSIRISDSVDIVGAGADKLTIDNQVTWITRSGHVNAGLPCDAGVVLIGTGDYAFKVENTSGAQIDVTISGVTFRRNFGIIETVSGPARVELRDVVVRETYGGPFNCVRPIVGVLGELRLIRAYFLENRIGAASFDDGLVEVRGSLVVEDSRFEANTAGSQIVHIGGSGADNKVRISASRFYTGYNRIILEGSDAVIVNSAFVQRLDTTSNMMGIHGVNTSLIITNSTITLPPTTGYVQGADRRPALGSHISLKGTFGFFIPQNTAIVAPGTLPGALPLVGLESGVVVSTAGAASSFVSDGSLAGAKSGDAKLTDIAFLCASKPDFCITPQDGTSPLIDGGVDSLAIDPGTLQPLTTPLLPHGLPRIMGPAVDIGAVESLADFARDDHYSILENDDLKVPVGVLANDSQANPTAARTAQLVAGPQHGILKLEPDGSFEYYVDANFYGTDSFTYQQVSGGTLSNVATVTIDIRKGADQLAIVPDAYTAPSSGTLDVPAPGVLDNDTHGHTFLLRLFTAALEQGPANGTVVLDPDGGFRYTPNAGFGGQDTFTYRFSSSGGKHRSLPTTVTITVPHGSHAPVAHDDVFATPQDTGFKVPPPNLLSNDVDADGDTLRVVSVSHAAHGTAVYLGGVLYYVPASGFLGTDTFTYTITDGTLHSTPATVTVTVNAANAPPSARSDAYATPEATLLAVGAPGVLGNDTDPDGDTLTASVVTGPSHGRLQLEATGGFAYTPDPGFTGADAFTYRVSDGRLGSDAVASIDVTAVNRAPIALPDVYGTTASAPLTVPAPSIFSNDHDPEGHDLKISAITSPSHGVVHLGRGQLVYRPDPGFTGVDVFTYRVTDGALESGDAAVTIHVTPRAVNLRPIAYPDTYSLPQDGSLDVSLPGVLRNDSDPEGHALTRELLTMPIHGALAPISGGGFRYVPDPGFSGRDEFTYRVSDGHLSSGPAKVTLLVHAPAVDLPPVAIDDHYSTIGNQRLQVAAPGITGNDGDPEGHALRVELTASPTHGTVAASPDGAFIYTPDPGFHGVDSFLYRVTDGANWSSAAMVTIDVTEVDTNLAPIARPDEYVVAQGRLVTIPVPGVLENDFDPEGHPLTAIPLSLPTIGSFAPIDGGGFTYAAPADFTGEEVFTYVVSDGEKTSAPTTVTLRVVSATGSCRPRPVRGRLAGAPSARWRPRLCEHGWFGVQTGY